MEKKEIVEGKPLSQWLKPFSCTFSKLDDADVVFINYDYNYCIYMLELAKVCSLCINYLICRKRKSHYSFTLMTKQILQ